MRHVYTAWRSFFPLNAAQPGLLRTGQTLLMARMRLTTLIPLSTTAETITLPHVMLSKQQRAHTLPQSSYLRRRRPPPIQPPIMPSPRREPPILKPFTTLWGSTEKSVMRCQYWHQESVERLRTRGELERYLHAELNLNGYYGEPLRWWQG
jgi:hypothetical protein